MSAPHIPSSALAMLLAVTVASLFGCSDPESSPAPATSDNAGNAEANADTNNSTDNAGGNGDNTPTDAGTNSTGGSDAPDNNTEPDDTENNGQGNNSQADAPDVPPDNNASDDTGAPDTSPDPPSDAIEGFGAVTQGAASSPDGFEACAVTLLSDDGSPGTLRDCLSAGKRHITFALGGTIVLESDLNVRYPYITIDGASAPAPGITIAQPGEIGTTIEARPSTGPAHDIVIRYLRMDGMATEHNNRGDIWGLDGQSEDVYNIVLDHITGIASTDGVFDIWENVRDVTISWCLILDTVTALHLSTSDLDQVRRRISFHHNVFAGNNERQVRIRHNNQMIDFTNNVIYGWGWLEGGGYGLRVVHDAGETNASVNVVNNVFHHVEGLHGGPNDAIQLDPGDDRGDVYLSGNIVPDEEADTGTTDTPLNIPPEAQVTTFEANTLGARVVPFAGTHYPTEAEMERLETIRAALEAN